MFQGSIPAAIFAAFLTCAVGALAQSAVSNSYDINLNNAVTVNNCSAGEPVALDGAVHIDVSVSEDGPGANHFSVKAAATLVGSGQTTGSVYVADDSDDYSSNTNDGSADLTVELKSDLKPHGVGSALTLVQSLHIVVDASGNISAQVVSNSTSCGS